MIAVLLKGGLGNQMFQYAAAYSVAQQLGVPLYLDKSFINHYPKTGKYTFRNYELNIFDIQETTIYSPIPTGWRNKYLYHLIRMKTLGINGLTTVDDRDFRVNDKIYLNGYFQNPEYFEKYATELKQIFNFENNLSDETIQLAKTLTEEDNAVVIHIRKGDFSKVDIYQYLDIDYYKEAIEILEKKTNGNLSFYVFGLFDDKFKQRIQTILPNNTSFIEPSKNRKAYEDIYLMKCAKHHIISNSTFAWWAAWLNENKDKIVIGPKKWLKSDTINPIMPRQWIAI